MKALESLHEDPRPLGCVAMLGFGLLLPALPLILFSCVLGLWWTSALAAASACAALGMLARAQRHVWAPWLFVAAGTLAFGPLVLRAALVRNDERVRLVQVTRSSRPRDAAPLLSRLFPEPEGSLAAATLLTWAGALHDPEAASFSRILAGAYARTDPPASSVPTPAIATYLGLQRPDDFELLVLPPPKGASEPRAALIFLHGFSGSFYVYCWEIAQAARAANLVTLCPSTDPVGAWWTARGEQTLRATVEHARGLGLRRLYLAGLSNGAAGASVLALRLESELAGLVLISGGRAGEPPNLPVLVLQGASDQMMPASYAREYAARKPNVRYQEVPGGHLVFLSEHQRLRALTSEFLRSLEGEHARPDAAR